MSPEISNDAMPAGATDSANSARFGMTRLGFWAANLFIVVWFALTAVHISPPGPLHDQLEDWTLPFTDLVKFNQHWSMFSPGVRNFNEYGQSAITFADGTVKLYEFHRQDKQRPFQQWLHGKMRELWLDQLLDTEIMDGLYPFVGRYIARANQFPANQPERISIGGEWQNIPPFTEFTAVDGLPSGYNHSTFGEYKVQPEDLR